MPISVNDQAYIFLCSVVGGALIAFIYDAFRIKRKAIKTNTIIIHLEDFLYWILVAIIMFAVVYYSNEGEIRGYIFIGTAIGIVLYLLLLSRFVVAAALFILTVLYKALKLIYSIISYPVVAFFRIISVPVRFLLKKTKAMWKKMRQLGKRRLTMVSIWHRIFKNARKKI